MRPSPSVQSEDARRGGAVRLAEHDSPQIGAEHDRTISGQEDRRLIVAQMTRRRDTVATVLGDVDKGRILAGCDEEQQAAITSDASPLLVVAGAGAGKTRILTRRIAWRVAQGDTGHVHVLALTFTRKAALEVRERLGELGLPERVTAGTSTRSLAQLRETAIDEGGEPPRVLDSKVRLLGKVVPSSSRGASSGAKPPRRELLSAVAGEIEWAKASRIPPED